MAPPSFAPIAQEGVLDDLYNHINSSILTKTEKKPNSQERGKERRRHWTPSEDLKLRESVEFHGLKNWKLISEKVTGRSGKSCRLRWLNQLDPRIKKTVFSREENEILIAAHKVYGNKWSMIATFLPGRTDNGIKNQWHVMTSRKQKNVTGVSSSGAFNGFGSGDHSGNGSTGSTITLLGKSNEGTSFSCMNTQTSPSVFAMVNGGSYRAGSAILVPSTFVTPRSPPQFIDFLGVGQ